MTTIVFRDGILASDSRATRGGWINVGEINKLRRVADGCCAIVGSPGETMAMCDWLTKPDGDRPKVTGDGTVIHVSRHGVMTVYEDGGAVVQGGQFMAWGSGAPVALGALHAGANARRAVEIACLVDPYSGGPVCWMDVRATAAEEFLKPMTDQLRSALRLEGFERPLGDKSWIY